MTRKDYVMLAEAIADAKPSAAHKAASAQVKLVATYIADGLAQDNPRFDRKRFMTACGFPA